MGAGRVSTRNSAKKSLDEDGLYVLEENGQIAASITINQEQPAEYAQVQWGCDAKPEEVMVIHLLCVRPSKAHRGLGHAMVQFILDEARKQGCKAVRPGHRRAKHSRPLPVYQDRFSSGRDRLYGHWRRDSPRRPSLFRICTLMPFYLSQQNHDNP